MALQQRISLARNQAQMGRPLDVLVEGEGKLSGRRVSSPWPAATASRAQVDGMVIVPGRLPIGQMARVRITGALEYDLMAEPVMAQALTLQ